MLIYRITNVKFSFTSRKKIKKFSGDPTISTAYIKSQNLIIKSEFGVFSLLSGNSSNINCTGVNSIKKIKTAVIFFAKISNQNLSNFHKFQIDCLAIRVDLKPNLKTNFLYKTSQNFKIIDTFRFPGLILKYQNKNIRISISYFNKKGCAIVTGLKNLGNLHKIINLLKSDFEF